MGHSMAIDCWLIHTHVQELLGAEKNWANNFAIWFWRRALCCGARREMQRPSERPTATEPPRRRSTEAPTNMATDPPRHRITGPPSSRATEQPSHQATLPRNHKATVLPRQRVRSTEPPNHIAPQRSALGPANPPARQPAVRPATMPHRIPAAQQSSQPSASQPPNIVAETPQNTTLAKRCN